MSLRKKKTLLPLFETIVDKRTEAMNNRSRRIYLNKRGWMCS